MFVYIYVLYMNIYINVMIYTCLIDVTSKYDIIEWNYLQVSSISYSSVYFQIIKYNQPILGCTLWV